jgi:hypothetical protein
MKPKKRRMDTSTLLVRAPLIILGTIGGAAGFYGFFHGHLWYSGYNANTGVFGTGASLYLGFLGLIFVVIGLINPKKKSD